MMDPVVDGEGNSYERAAITEYLEKHQTSPITGRPLKAKELKPNRALKELIEGYRKDCGGKVEEKRVVVRKAEAEGGKGGIEVKVESSESGVLVSLVPPEGSHRTPVDICCVIDSSGSMSTEATVKTETGKTESHGLTILDIVKHAVQTIIESLDENDRLSVVNFESKSSVLSPLQHMSKQSKQSTTKAVKKLQASGGTNLWNGVQTAFDHLKDDKAADRLKIILLLTDGEPTDSHPEGHVQVFRKYLDANPSAKNFLFFTFGFGYKLNSTLLNDLAVAGNGTYSFIPDCNFVGTVFINTMANLSTILASNVEITLSGLPSSDLRVLGGYPFQVENSEFRVKVGFIRYGQSKEVVIKMGKKGGHDLVGLLKYHDASNRNRVVEVKVGSTSLSTPSDLMVVHELRLKTVDLLHSIMKLSLKESTKQTKELIQEIQKSSVYNQDYVKDLCKDLEGQVLEAVADNTAFDRWGKHYLPSLALAHLLQQCNNFKDPGVQRYGGKLFLDIQKKADKLFSDIPPPQPSKKTTAAPVASMATYNNAYGGCFDGECWVEMGDGRIVKVKDVRKGDELRGPGGVPARVRCVVKTKIEGSCTALVEFEGGLKITAWHPVRLEGQWHFPVEIRPIRWVQCEEVFTFVLEGGHTAMVNGVECVTLGHGFVGDVVGHHYFGTELVVDDLKRMRGWENGVVQLGGAERQSTGLIGRVLEATIPVF
uniref:VWFA domain-containing protein n=1 Tax=Arcella intermedia TaxID=1963864 RepID=A0A6B2KYL0_9EUKA